MARRVCVTDTCSVQIRNVVCDDRICLEAAARIYNPISPQPAGALAICNALQCIPDILNSDGTVSKPGGLAVLVRSSSCITLGCVYDMTGVMAVEAGLSIFGPPTRPTDIAPDELCWPGDNGIQCVPNSDARHGGVAFIVKPSFSVNLYVKQNELCVIAYKQIVADVVINPCANNALAVTELGMGVLAKSTNCFGFTIDVDVTTCLPVPTRTLKLSPAIANDARNAFTCVGGGVASDGSYGGMAVLARDTDCIRLSVIDDGVARWLEASPIVCPAPDNAFDCTGSGMSISFGSTCTLALRVEPQQAGCGGTKVVRAYVVVSGDQGAALNATTQSGSGLATMIRPSLCIAPQVAVEAVAAGEDGCSGSPRITQLIPIICESSNNFIECGPNGLGAYVTDSCVIKLIVENEASPGCSNSRLIRGWFYKALDFGGTTSDPLYTYNMTVQAEEGLATMVRRSDCIRHVIVQEASNQDSDGCDGKPRITEFQWILATDSSNGLVQTDAGLAAFVSSIDQTTGLKSCVKMTVQSTEVNGIPSRSIIADLVIDTLIPADKQALRCGRNGAFVGTRDTPSTATRTNAGTGAISMVPSFANIQGNALHCRTGCGQSGLAVVFRDFTCTIPSVVFGLTNGPCGSTDIVASVAIAASAPSGYPKASSKSNGLVARPDGLWAPPNTTGDTGHHGVGGMTETLTFGGQDLAITHIAKLTTDYNIFPDGSACNISDCRKASAFVVFRAPAVTLRVRPNKGETGSVTVRYSGKVGIDGATTSFSAEYASFTVPEGGEGGNQVDWDGPGWEVMVSGQTEFFIVDEIPPGKCLACEMTPSAEFVLEAGGGTASAELRSISVDAWVWSVLSPDEFITSTEAFTDVADSIKILAGATNAAVKTASTPTADSSSFGFNPAAGGFGAGSPAGQFGAFPSGFGFNPAAGGFGAGSGGSATSRGGNTTVTPSRPSAFSGATAGVGFGSAATPSRAGTGSGEAARLGGGSSLSPAGQSQRAATNAAIATADEVLRLLVQRLKAAK